MGEVVTNSERPLRGWESSSVAFLNISQICDLVFCVYLLCLVCNRLGLDTCTLRLFCISWGLMMFEVLFHQICEWFMSSRQTCAPLGLIKMSMRCCSSIPVWPTFLLAPIFSLIINFSTEPKMATPQVAGPPPSNALCDVRICALIFFPS